MEGKIEDTMCLTFKVILSHKFSPILEELYKNSLTEVKKMLQNRKESSSKYYKSIPCVVAKSLITKYQQNKKCKGIKSLTIPICGDKGKQVKIVEGGVRIPAIFKKEVIPVPFPKKIFGNIRQVEFFKRKRKWFMSYSYDVLKEKPINTNACIGVDRNSVGNVATVAVANNIVFLGPSSAGLSKNFRNRRAKLQKKGAKDALKKIKRKQSNRTKEINHKVSKEIVNLAKLHCSAIALENLGQISKKGKAKRYVQKSQWSFYQLETFIKYKAALLGVPLIFVNPAYTSQGCSECGSINKTQGKKYMCKTCGYVAHRDANASINIRKLGEQGLSRNNSGLIDDPLNEIGSMVDLKLESSGDAR